MSHLILPYKDQFPKIDPHAYIAETASVIGDVEIRADASIWFGCTLRGDVSYIRIGERTNIQDGTVIHVSRVGHSHTIIGHDVSIGHMALIHACTLEDGAFIGMKACVMDGAVVEKGAMVAAGALVPPGKRVKSGQIWGGSPAHYMRDITDDEKEHFSGIASHYVKLSKSYLDA